MVVDGTPDTEMVFERARSGDAAGWDELLRRFGPLIRTVTKRHGLDPETSADVAQVVWLKLFEHVERIRDPRRLAGWIATTSRNECLNQLDNGRRVQPSASEDLAGDTDGGLDLRLLTEEANDEVRRALETLPPQVQEFIRLLAVRPRLTYVEIAERTGRPLGSIGPTRGRYLALFQARLRAMGVSERAA